MSNIGSQTLYDWKYLVVLFTGYVSLWLTIVHSIRCWVANPFWLKIFRGYVSLWLNSVFPVSDVGSQTLSDWKCLVILLTDYYKSMTYYCFQYQMVGRKPLWLEKCFVLLTMCVSQCDLLWPLWGKFHWLLLSGWKWIVCHCESQTHFGLLLVIVLVQLISLFG